jgi:outer membrane protein assembly factor BamB
MEIMDVLHWLNQNHALAVKNFDSGIIPMVLIPLTAVTVVLTSLAGIIAGWFGIKLHTEGPKQFLEVLLKKRVLISMIIVNLVGIGCYKGYIYVKNLPRFITTINRHSDNEAVLSHKIYSESFTRNHDFLGKIIDPKFKSLTLEKNIKLPKGAFRSAAISGDSMFYGVDDGNIYEINKNDLSVIRKFYVGTQVTTRPVLYQNKIYTGEGSHDTHHARIYSFDLRTGKYLNSFTTKGHTEGQPYLGQYHGRDLLFAVGGSGGVYALDPNTMKEVWHQFDGHVDGTVTVENNFVYVGSGVEKGTLRDRSYAIAYDFETGNKIWKKELPLSNWMHPIVTSTDVCYVLGEIYFDSSVGLFYCLNKLDGTPHFSLPFNAPIASKPFYIRDGQNEYAFFADFKGEACGVDLIKKEKMWCYKTGKETTDYALSSFEYDSKRGILWYPSLDNGIFAFEVKTGKVLTHWMPNPKDGKWKSNYAAVNIDGDDLFLLDIAGNLRKFSIQ